MQGREAPAAGPQRRVKRIVTIAIALHFFAIFTTVVGTSTFRYPAPTIVEWFRFTWPVNFYLQSLFLTNPYRFYAPDPGPTSLMWFRLQYADGAVRWVELARRDEFRLRIPYQRHMSLVMLLAGMSFMPDPADPRGVLISSEGKIGLSSFARHLAETHPRIASDGTRIHVDWLTAYLVYHDILVPGQIWLGWEPDDLRLYQITFLGQYQANGVRGDLLAPNGRLAPSASFLLAEYLLQDIAPKAVALSPDQRSTMVAEMDMPRTWQKLLSQYPDLFNDLSPVDPDEDRSERIMQLVKRIEKHVMERSKPLSQEWWERAWQ